MLNTKAANICAIAIFIFLSTISAISAVGNMQSYEIISIGLLVAAFLIMLSMFIRHLHNPRLLGFMIPFILFLFYTILMAIIGWNSPYYLLVCLCICGISCLYAVFNTTVRFIIVQNLIIAAIIFNGTRVLGPSVSLPVIMVTWGFSLFGVFVLLLITRYATVHLDIAVEDQKSFRSLLDTTSNYVIMVDELNNVINLSTPMAQIAQIGRTELARGRALIDLFPGRELKLLVYKMLENKKSYEGDWEFTLNGQKRFFKAVSTSVAGSANDTLITLHDMTHLAERDEIALMRDNLAIGLFFMDRDFIIQDQYSRFLEEMLLEKDLFGRNFLDILSASFTAKELDTIRDYFEMVFTGAFDQSMLREINPLDELKYVSSRISRIKVFHCSFSTIERSQGKVFILVTIYDITAKIELQQRLLEEENRRQEEMQTIFELIQVEPGVFNDFMEDAEYEFERITDIQRQTNLSSHDVLVDIYQCVHAIKSNAAILGLNTFGNKVHALETKIKKLREQEEEVSFDDMLRLAMGLEKLAQEKDGFRVTIEKIESYNKSSSEVQNQSEYVFVETLSKTAHRAAEDLEKKVKLVAESIDNEMLENGPRRIMKEVLMQLIRNSVAHGIEIPEEREAAGKDQTGIIRISIKKEDGKIHIVLDDDGKGLNFDRICERAVEQNLIQEEEKENKGALLKAIFMPGFSTAEFEGLHAGRGIGLNLVQDRIRDAHGSITVKTVPGKGTSFNLYLPIGEEISLPDTEGPVLLE